MLYFRYNHSIMNEQLTPLIDYIAQQLAAGANEAVLRQTLLQYGWDLASIDAAFTALQTNIHSSTTSVHVTPQTQPTTSQELFAVDQAATSLQSNPIVASPHYSMHRIRSSVAWIASPLAFLVLAVIVTIANDATNDAIQPLRVAIAVISTVGTAMLVVGPAIGIYRLFKRS